MAAALEQRGTPRAAALRDWLPIAAGLLALYGPTFYNLAQWQWNQDDASHGPVILAVLGWLVWRRRDALVAQGGPRSPGWGYALTLLGLLAYVLGRSQQIAFLEVGSLAPVAAGILLVMRGGAALRALWFAILFALFLIPLPGLLVDAFTGPLKHAVSGIAEQVLYAAGYPVARSGVILTIGPYQLLVADACSGLHSMISLSALGLLYVYLSPRPGAAHKALVIASILPVAFAANVVRVLLLLLITYHLGDAAGQSFLHGATGIVLLLVALSILFVLDAVFAAIGARLRPR